MSRVLPSLTEGEVSTDLAAAYCLAESAGWDDTVYTHLPTAVPGEAGHEFGLALYEI
jgi:hypothetical protein